MSMGIRIILLIILAGIIISAFLIFRRKKSVDVNPRIDPILQNAARENKYVQDEILDDKRSPVLGDPTLASLGFGNIDPIDEKILSQQTTPKTRITKPIVKFPEKAVKASLLLTLYVVPKSGQQFLGYELLQSLLAADLRYGAMSIFHRHEKLQGQGRIIFSVASAVEPGTFDLGRIGALACPGLCLFINIEDSDEALQDFELMLATAQQLADDLQGEVQDDQHVKLTQSLIEKYNVKIFQHRRQLLEQSL